jgi:hypothetical protein
MLSALFKDSLNRSCLFITLAIVSVLNKRQRKKHFYGHFFPTSFYTNSNQGVPQYMCTAAQD